MPAPTSDGATLDGIGSVLVTGGTGFLGLHTCKHLADRGVDARALDLKGFQPEDKHGGATFVEADVRDHERVEKAIEGVDAVVHAAAALPLWTPGEIRDVTIEGTRTVLDAALAEGVDRVVYISSTAVYGTHEFHPITEDSPLEGVGPYGEAKIEAEKLCRSYREEGLTVPILRPKTFIGPQRLGVFQILFDWVEDGASIPMVGKGDNEYQLLHVEDLVRAIELALTYEPADEVDDTFNVGADEFGTMREDFQALIDHAGTGKQVRGTPAFLTRWTLRALEKLGVSPLYEWVYETAHQDSYVSVEKLKELGWAPKHTNKDALIDTYEWYLENAPELEGGAGVDHRVGWDQGALKGVKKLYQLI